MSLLLKRSFFSLINPVNTDYLNAVSGIGWIQVCLEKPEVFRDVVCSVSNDHSETLNRFFTFFAFCKKVTKQRQRNNTKIMDILKRNVNSLAWKSWKLDKSCLTSLLLAVCNTAFTVTPPAPLSIPSPLSSPSPSPWIATTLLSPWRSTVKYSLTSALWADVCPSLEF